ncbi:MAG: penicillin-binding transpeptidase domain-containing protein [bacterium]|nr:penicillin-binding transpeptidase domain-containing protein [bacterium]
MRLFKRNASKKKWESREIDPDEILLDATNLPKFDQSQFEGRLERPLKKSTVVTTGVIFVTILLAFTGKISLLQIEQGASYTRKSAANSLRQTTIFPERGVIYDRNKILLVSNSPSEKNNEFAKRTYASIQGMAHILGYIRYPAKDSNGFYYQDRYEGLDGVEKIYNTALAGKNGLKIVEVNAHGEIEAESPGLLEPPRAGVNIVLSVDSRLQSKLYEITKDLALEIGFDGGAAAIMDIANGEIVAAVSYPEYDSGVMSDGTNSTKIKTFINNAQKPFLNRVTYGLYTPGSILKPFIAIAALKEEIIDPKKKILSTGSIAIQNPFDPKKKSVFKDWKVHGYVDMREALAVSSDVYFYEIGGGFEDQIGLGIERIEKYLRLFGFGQTLEGNPLLNKTGSIPSPAWKKENFQGDPWRVGDTYNTSIGQYGFQVTPLQVVRAVAAIANGGTLMSPTLLKTNELEAGQYLQTLPFAENHVKIVKEGMRLAVTNGTAKALNIPEVTVAAKTGTAELGIYKKFVNSWIVGFFPYEKPRFAFTVIMEKGPYENTVGGLYVMRKLLEWMAIHTPEYLTEVKSVK